MDTSAASPAAPTPPSLARRASTLSSELRWSVALPASGGGAGAAAVRVLARRRERGDGAPGDIRWSSVKCFAGSSRGSAPSEPKLPPCLGVVRIGALSVVRRRPTVREPATMAAGGDEEEYAATAAAAGESARAVSPPPPLPLSPSNASSCALQPRPRVRRSCHAAPRHERRRLRRHGTAAGCRCRGQAVHSRAATASAAAARFLPCLWASLASLAALSAALPAEPAPASAPPPVAGAATPRVQE